MARTCIRAQGAAISRIDFDSTSTQARYTVCVECKEVNAEGGPIGLSAVGIDNSLAGAVDKAFMNLLTVVDEYGGKEDPFKPELVATPVVVDGPTDPS